MWLNALEETPRTWRPLLESTGVIGVRRKARLGLDKTADVLQLLQGEGAGEAKELRIAAHNFKSYSAEMAERWNERARRVSL